VEHVFQLTLNLFALAIQTLDGPVRDVKSLFATLHVSQAAAFFPTSVTALALVSLEVLATFTPVKFHASMTGIAWAQINVIVPLLEAMLELTVKFQHVIKTPMVVDV